MKELADRYGIRASTGYWVQRLASSMDEHLKAQLVQQGVAKWFWPILSAIHAGDARTPMEVSRFVGMDPSAVTRKLDRLEAEGLVTRHPNGADRRSITLALTSKAKRLVGKLAACSQATNEKFLTGVSESDAQTLTRIIGKMLENADQPVRRL